MEDYILEGNYTRFRNYTSTLARNPVYEKLTRFNVTKILNLLNTVRIKHCLLKLYLLILNQTRKVKTINLHYFHINSGHTKSLLDLYIPGL